jgi:dolichol-phosphate mannosyltransferase
VAADVLVSFIVPCLNEEQNIPRLTTQLLKLCDDEGIKGEVLLVDDCSDDLTFRAAIEEERKDERVRALHKGLPRGIGHGIRFATAAARGDMTVVVMGDGVDPLEAVPEFRRRIVDEGADLVLLNRYRVPGDDRTIPPLYRFYQWWYRRLLKLLIGVALTDPTYAYRAARTDFLRTLGLTSGGFEISPEVTIKTVLAKGRISEVAGHQGRRISGESKFLFSRAGWGYARVLAQGVGCRLTGVWIGSGWRPLKRRAD